MHKKQGHLRPPGNTEPYCSSFLVGVTAARARQKNACGSSRKQYKSTKVERRREKWKLHRLLQNVIAELYLYHVQVTEPAAYTEFRFDRGEQQLSVTTATWSIWNFQTHGR
jgi:hypothetical protein